MTKESLKLIILVAGFVTLITFGFYVHMQSIKECMEEGHGFYYCNGLMNNR